MSDSPLQGIVVVDKPSGWTSHQVVGRCRRLLGTRKVGHAGTLDPMATGVLVVGFGNATRLLNYIVDHDKTYLATIRLGQRTTTDDADGELLQLRDTKISYGAIEAVKGISLELARGELVSLIGANGAGKTSTLKAISRDRKSVV